MIVNAMPYETLVKKVQDLKTKPLYEHRIDISKSCEQGTNNTSFHIYLTLYRTKAEALKASEIYQYVKYGTLCMLNLSDDSDAFRVPIGYTMYNKDYLSISYYNNDGSCSALNYYYSKGDFTITDTVTEV